MTLSVKAEEARNNFSDIVNRAAYGHERIIVTRRGKGGAAVVPMEDLKLIEQLVLVVRLGNRKEVYRDTAAPCRAIAAWESSRR